VVEDTGIGMDSQTQAKLFRPYVQGEASTTRRFGGTGLGLAICHHLVTRLGGSIGVSSRAGEGSTFAFHVDAGQLDGPLVSDDAPAEAVRADEPAAPERVDGMRILLVEDGDDNRRLLVHFLATAGARVETASDGEAGVATALRKHAAGTPFDLVLMDMQMPVLDGYAAANRLRAAGYRHPIVALTADAMAADRERCLSAGCDDYCAKPVRRAQLLEKAARWRRTGVTEGPHMADGSKGRTEARGDDDLVALVRMFVGELHEDVESMRRALAQGDLERVTLLAHRLKGAAGSYGFPEITRQAALLERAARAGAAPDAVACEIASLDAICRVTGGNPPGRAA
jgi:CheY-like chemotaxis protein/HPt (histidine-containing phosphotransfer) domain-containing protein